MLTAREISHVFSLITYHDKTRNLAIKQGTNIRVDLKGVCKPCLQSRCGRVLFRFLLDVHYATCLGVHRVRVCVRACVRACVCVFVSVRACMCACVHACVRPFMHECMCICFFNYDFKTNNATLIWRTTLSLLFLVSSQLSLLFLVNSQPWTSLPL